MQWAKLPQNVLLETCSKWTIAGQEARLALLQLSVPLELLPPPRRIWFLFDFSTNGVVCFAFCCFFFFFPKTAVTVKCQAIPAVLQMAPGHSNRTVYLLKNQHGNPWQHLLAAGAPEGRQRCCCGRMLPQRGRGHRFLGRRKVLDLPSSSARLQSGTLAGMVLPSIVRDAGAQAASAFMATARLLSGEQWCCKGKTMQVFSGGNAELHAIGSSRHYVLVIWVFFMPVKTVP